MRGFLIAVISGAVGFVCLLALGTARDYVDQGRYSVAGIVGTNRGGYAVLMDNRNGTFFLAPLPEPPVPDSPVPPSDKKTEL